MKRVLVLICLLLLAGALPIRAYDFSAFKPAGYVSDFARVVDEKSRLSLERYAAVLERQTGAQMALVTLESLYGEPIEDVANLLYRRWGVGQKGTNEGVLLLLVINDRRSRLEVGYGLEPILPDGYAGSVLRSMRPALRAQQYGPALIEAANMIGTRIAEAKNVSLDVRLPRRREFSRGESPLPVGVLVIGFIVLFIFFGGALAAFRGRRYRGFRGSGALPAAILLDILTNSSRGHRGGGGFGGFDSGGFGGFGGFGGGSSGGGGASSSW